MTLLGVPFSFLSACRAGLGKLGCGVPRGVATAAAECYYMLYHKRDRNKFVLSGKMLNDKTIKSITTFFRLSLSRKSLTIRSNVKRWIVSASVTFPKLQRSSTDGSARPPTASAARVLDARPLFATINAATSLTKEIGAILVMSMTIAVATTTTPPTECQSANVANAWLAMGIALMTISLESRSHRLAARKTAKARAPRAKCIIIRVTRQSMSGLNAWRTRPIKRSRRRSVWKHTTLTTSVALQVTLQASATTAQRWQATSSAKGTVVAWITLCRCHLGLALQASQTQGNTF